MCVCLGVGEVVIGGFFAAMIIRWRTWRKRRHQKDIRDASQ